MKYFWLSAPLPDWLFEYTHFPQSVPYLRPESSWSCSIYSRSWTNVLRRIVSSIYVQNLNRAAPAMFRMQIEQTWMHLEQPRPRLEIKWEILAIFEPQLKKFKCLLKIKGKLFKNWNISRLMSSARPWKLYKFQVILIWCHSPFKKTSCFSMGRSYSSYSYSSTR